MDYQLQIEEIIEKVTEIIGTFEDRTIKTGDMGDLSMRSIIYLSLIDKIPDPTISSLAEVMDVTKPTVTVTVQRLVKEGYVRKERSLEDRRVYYLHLTEKGRRFNETHNSAHREFAQLLLQTLDEAEVRQLITIFTKLFQQKPFQTGFKGT